MLHAVSPFHARKIKDEFLVSEHKKANGLDDACDIYKWYTSRNAQLKDHMLPILIIPLTRKEIEALKVYTTYWLTYKSYIVKNYDIIKQDASTLDTFPPKLLHVIEMHYKKIQTPIHATDDGTKWGERFNYSIIDGMEKYIDSMQLLQRKLNHCLSCYDGKQLQDKSLFIVPRLSLDMLLPFDSIYESMHIFNILDKLQKPQTDDGCHILRKFHDSVWNSLRFKQHSETNKNDTYDILDIFCRSGLILRQLNLAMLKFPEEDEKKDSTETDKKQKISMILQIYCIADKDMDVQSMDIMDYMLEFRMFIANKCIPSGITQMQTFLNITSQDHVKQASKAFLIALETKTVLLWNGVLQLNENNNKEEDEKYDHFETFKANIKRVLLRKYNQIKDALMLVVNIDHFCIDFVITREMNGFDVKIAMIHRLPIYPHDYGMYIWANDKQQILNKSSKETQNDWNVEVKKSRASRMDFNDTKAVLSANVYSCVMDYFVRNKWIQKQNHNNIQRNASSFCVVL